MSNYPINDTHRLKAKPLDLKPRYLFGPGPSNAHPRILQAIANRQVGHLDPQFLLLMDEVQELLRYAFQTDNTFTIPVSGTGSAAMEASLANLIEPGEKTLIAINGYFGNRLVDMASRYGAEIATINRPWGEVFESDEIERALEKHRPAVMGIVHAETSTGARQPLEGLGELCRRYNCLLVVDAVTSLGGVPLFVDAWKIDAAYSGSQKCLNCPPGISPLTMNERAVAKIRNRKSKVANWYLDMTMLMNYWGGNRTYHHTAPINMNYAIREALSLVAEEGLDARWQRHRDTAAQLWKGLEEMGLSCHVAADNRLPSLTTTCIPEGINGKEVQHRLLDEFNIEIAGGLGELSGKVWRIGMMGYNAQSENVMMLLSAMNIILAGQRQ